jgi:alkaline phosphatase D
LDAWNGYPAARQRLYEAVAKNTNNTVVVTGDTHNAWAIDLQNQDGSVGYGLEIATPSISSPGLSELLELDPERLAALIRQKNPQVRFMDAGRRGYVMLTFTPESMTADYYFLDTVGSRDYTEIKGESVRLARRRTAS